MISSSLRPLPDNTQHSQQTSMPPVGFEATISAGELPQTETYIKMNKSNFNINWCGHNILNSVLTNQTPLNTIWAWVFITVTSHHWCYIIMCNIYWLPNAMAARSRRGSAAARLLGWRFRVLPGHGCLSVVCVVCCQVEVSASGWSLIQRSPTKCGVSECVRMTSITRRP